MILFKTNKLIYITLNIKENGYQIQPTQRNTKIRITHPLTSDKQYKTLAMFLTLVFLSVSSKQELQTNKSNIKSFDKNKKKTCTL